jgi:epoxyqueuosine reductase
MSLTKEIKARARASGFDLVGVAPVGPVPELSFYLEWLAAGHAGGMDYLKRNTDVRQDVGLIVPEAKSVIACAMIYHSDQPLSTTCKDTKRGWISRYAWGDDYHDVLRTRLLALNRYIADCVGTDYVSRVYVDTGPVVDRVHAKYAGIGWFGKNTCIINQSVGSWFFLGEIITNLELTYDVPAPDRCGSCTRCLDACPTDAIVEPYVLDSNRCISYLTIELRGEIPIEYRDDLGNHVFGCDICQDVCPWNRKAMTTGEAAFQPRERLMNPSLVELARLDEHKFRELFRKSPVKRAKRQGIMRNLAVAMGNSGETACLPALSDMLENETAMVAEHARWAIDKIVDRNTSANIDSMQIKT